MVKLFGYSFEERSAEIGADSFEVRGVLVKDGKRIAEVFIPGFSEKNKYNVLVSADEWGRVCKDVQSAYTALGNDVEYYDAVGVLIGDIHCISAWDKELSEEARKNGVVGATLSVYTEDNDFGFVGIGASYSSDVPDWAIDVLGKYPFGQIDVPRVA